MNHKKELLRGLWVTSLTTVIVINNASRQQPIAAASTAVEMTTNYCF